MTYVQTSAVARFDYHDNDLVGSIDKYVCEFMILSDRNR